MQQVADLVHKSILCVPLPHSKLTRERQNEYNNNLNTVIKIWLESSNILSRSINEKNIQASLEGKTHATY